MMIWILVGGAVLGLVGLVWVVWWAWDCYARNRAYKKVFAEENYVDLARLLETTKAAACAQKHEPLPDPPVPVGPPRQFTTPAGIRVIYTVVRVDGAYEHHYSISLYSRDYTPSAVGSLFTVYVAWLLGIEPDHLSVVTVSENAVYHSEFHLSEEEQVAFEARPIPQPSHREVQEIMAHCFVLIPKLSYEFTGVVSPFSEAERRFAQRAMRKWVRMVNDELGNTEAS